MAEGTTAVSPPKAFKITPDELRKAGLWDTYCVIRDGCLKSGLNAKEAKKKTLGEIYPLLPNNNEDSSLSDSSSAANRKPPVIDDQGGTCSLDDDYMEREAGIVDVIMWVAKYLEVPEDEVGPQDAPSPEAWGMLLSYRSCQERRDDFWDKIYMKLVPSKAQIETSKSTEQIDGSNITRTIDRIIKLNKKLKKSSLNTMSCNKIAEKLKANKKHKHKTVPLAAGVKWGVQKRKR